MTTNHRHFPHYRIALAYAVELFRAHAKEWCVAGFVVALTLSISHLSINQIMHAEEQKVQSILQVHSNQELMNAIESTLIDIEKHPEWIMKPETRPVNHNISIFLPLFKTVGLLSVIKLAMMFSSFFLLRIFTLHRLSYQADTSLSTLIALPLLALRSILLSFVIFFRSFLWIPLIGPLIALFLVPRFFLALPLLMSGKTSVLESVSVSMKQSKGHSIELWIHVLCILSISILTAITNSILSQAIALFSEKISILFSLFISAMLIIFIATYQKAVMGEGE